MDQYLFLDSAFALLFFTICLLVVVRRVSINHVLLPVDYSIIFCALVYGVSWIAVMASLSSGGHSIYGHLFAPFTSRFALHTAGASLTVAGLLFGWRLAASKLSRGIGAHRGSDQVGISYNSIRGYELVFWIMLLCALISQYLYTLDYGGFIGALDYSILIRSGLFDSFERSRFSFLQPFGDFALLSCYGFWGLILSRQWTWRIFAGFTLALGAAMYVLWLQQGRFNAVVFMSVLALSLAYVWRVRPVFMILTLCAAVPLSVAAAFYISLSVNLKAASSFSEFYSREISFPFVAFFAQLSNPDGLFRFFYDVVTAPLYLLPSSLTQGWLDNPGDLNTRLIHGAPKGELGVTSAMPVDIVTMGLMQMGFAGVFPYAAMYGALLAACYRLCMNVGHPGLRCVCLSYLCIRLAGLGLFYAQPSDIVVGNFAAIATVVSALAWSALTRRAGVLGKEL